MIEHLVLWSYFCPLQLLYYLLISSRKHFKMAKAYEDGRAMSISSVHFASGRYHAVRKHLGKWLSLKITLLWAFCREISHGLDTALLRERVTLKRGKKCVCIDLLSSETARTAFVSKSKVFQFHLFSYSLSFCRTLHAVAFFLYFVGTLDFLTMFR